MFLPARLLRAAQLRKRKSEFTPIRDSADGISRGTVPLPIGPLSPRLFTPKNSSTDGGTNPLLRRNQGWLFQVNGFCAGRMVGRCRRHALRRVRLLTVRPRHRMGRRPVFPARTRRLRPDGSSGSPPLGVAPGAVPASQPKGAGRRSSPFPANGKGESLMPTRKARADPRSPTVLEKIKAKPLLPRQAFPSIVGPGRRICPIAPSRRWAISRSCRLAKATIR